MNNIKRVYVAHTINTVAGSVISVYVPAYLLTLGYPLSRVVLFFAIVHGLGLLFALCIFVPLVQRWGLLHTFKLYYPFQILFLFLLIMLKLHLVAPEVVAVFSGLATFAYWVPLNIFFIRFSERKNMGSNLSLFFALPSLFGIIGPLLGAKVVPIIGFWPVFVLTIVGMFTSFIPLASLKNEDVTINFSLSKAIQALNKKRVLFLFEFLENIIEESEWFWAIYVFISIRSLATPGIVGSLQAIGGSVFTLLIGKYVNKHGKKLIPIFASSLLFINILRIFIQQSLIVYSITIIAAFLLNAFSVSYFSTMYKTVKNNNEEEFMVLREIPTVLGRMAVFGIIFFTLPFLRFFFILPFITILFMIGLYVYKGKKLNA